MADIRINALTNTATSAASDDYLALDGSANGTRKILATNVAQNVTDVTFGSSGPSAKSSIAARAARQGLVFDGTAQAATGSTAIPAFGTSDFSVSAVINTDLTVSNQGIIGPNDSNAFGLFVYTSGLLGAQNAGVTTVGNSTGAILANKTAHVAYVRSGTTGTFYINGVAAGSITDSTNYSNRTYLIGNVGGLNIFKGTIAQPLIYNRALSAAEVVALYEAGVPAGADYNTASNTSVLTGANSDFSSAGNWVVSGGTTISGGKLNLSDFAVAYNSLAKLTKGLRYKLTITIDSVSVVGTQVQYYDGVNWNTIATTAGTYTVEFTCPGTYAAGLHLRTNGGNAVLDTALYYQLGLLLAPDAGQAGNGYVWNDMSGNVAQIALPSSGVTWNVPSIAGNRIRGTTNTNGNQQLLGASVLLPAESQILYVRARSRSGTPSITIGTASGGAQIVASVALSTTWQNLTIALTGGIVSSADDIWIGSNSTDVVETDISWQPLDF